LLQAVPSGGRQVRQLPAEQTAFALQTFPHAPQLSGSFWRSTQVPPQSIWPAGQAQAPALQTPPAGQTLPQAPQLAGSAVRLTHSPPHWVRPVAQTQVPPLQVSSE